LRTASNDKADKGDETQEDDEGTTGVRYRDFLEGVAVRRIAQNSAAIREAFRTFDPDGKGYITRNDIRCMLADQLIPDEQAKDLMDQCDKTGDGLVDYEDFARVFGKELAHGPVVSPTQSERASSVRSQAGSDDEDNGSEERDKLAELPETKRGEDDLHDPMQFSTSLAGSSELDRSEIDDDTDGVNRVVSMSNEAFKIRQHPGFHTKVLRPYYAAQPVSNVVIGLIYGTSTFARHAAALKLATIVHTCCGWFFLMPNPKTVTDLRQYRQQVTQGLGAHRFVAWWIHPRFTPHMRQWFEKVSYEGMDEELHRERVEYAGFQSSPVA
jgi:hypothetical protein